MERWCCNKDYGIDKRNSSEFHDFDEYFRRKFQGYDPNVVAYHIFFDGIVMTILSAMTDICYEHNCPWYIVARMLS